MPYEKTYINGRNSLHYDLKTINTSRNIHWFDNKTIIILVHNKHSDSWMHSGMWKIQQQQRHIKVISTELTIRE